MLRAALEKISKSPRPKLLVATLGAIIMEYEDMQIAVDFMLQAARNVDIRWNAAIEHFAPTFFDSWLRVKHHLETFRQRRTYPVSNLLFPNSPHPNISVGPFPWQVTQRLLALPSNFPPAYSSYLYGKRTLEQAVCVLRILLSLPGQVYSHPKWFPQQVTETLYDKELGVSRHFAINRATIALCTPYKIVEVVRARMVDAYLIIVPRDSVATMSATRSILAQEAAFAAYLDPGTRATRIFGSQ
jgi:hypothetical protein